MMSLCRRTLVVITASLAALMLAGCAAAAPSDPLGPQRREQIRQAILDAHWSDVVRDYPDALRPVVPIMRPVADNDHAAAFFECMRASGVPASPSDNGFRYNSSLGQSLLEFNSVRYVCESSAPSESEVVSYLSGSSRAALFDYQRKIVRPCLLAAGARSSAPPDGGPAYYLSAALAAWSPFAEILASKPRADTLAYLEKRCPPLPAWLDLTDTGPATRTSG
ncbi:hypothetical protein F1C58_06140 [Glaciihabitans sp. INWT7]|uniref:hypothetical protein n=1 Tax=Glaciihabitans sp. INWT7 TaxID=2596912 RepID=UPI001626E67A|nr:hypothetical protein [Glaciihabitans sp. INWT7]QNE46530.1 hypothetical protein F1C58_06140 [Glaciihabitans sp. INWT7]